MDNLVEIFNQRKRRGGGMFVNVATDKTMWLIKGKVKKSPHGSDPITNIWGKPTTAIVAKSV